MNTDSAWGWCSARRRMYFEEDPPGKRSLEGSNHVRYIRSARYPDEVSGAATEAITRAKPWNRRIGFGQGQESLGPDAFQALLTLYPGYALYRANAREGVDMPVTSFDLTEMPCHAGANSARPEGASRVDIHARSQRKPPQPPQCQCNGLAGPQQEGVGSGVLRQGLGGPGSPGDGGLTHGVWVGGCGSGAEFRLWPEKPPRRNPAS
jgi:hypothetical protein